MNGSTLRSPNIMPARTLRKEVEGSVKLSGSYCAVLGSWVGGSHLSCASYSESRRKKESRLEILKRYSRPTETVKGGFEGLLSPEMEPRMPSPAAAIGAGRLPLTSG